MSEVQVTKRTRCRLCDSMDLALVIPLKPTPVAEKYVTSEEVSVQQPFFPLDLYICEGCGHVQLLDVVDPKFLFDQYTYQSSSTAGLVKHFDECAQMITTEYSFKSQDLVLDIGSNDGALLKCFQTRGFRVLGVDPAEAIAKLASKSGVYTYPDFMTVDLAERIRKEHGAAKIVTAFNAFAHADDLSEIVKSVKASLDSDGIFVFEVSYLLDIIDHKLLGTIFHEHLSYHSLKPLIKFFEEHELEFIDVKRVTIQGGSLIGVVQHRFGSHRASRRVGEVLALEEKRKLDDPETLRQFGESLKNLRLELGTLCGDLKKKGYTIAGFGAARSGTTLISQMELGKQIQWIFDDHPEKVFKFSPGDHIPVYPTADLYARKPDYVFILAWIHSKKIIETHRRYLDEGGRFIVCFPEINIIEKS